MDRVCCILQTFVPDFHVLGEHSSHTGGDHVPQTSGGTVGGDVDQGDCSFRTFSEKIPLCSLVPWTRSPVSRLTV